MTTAYPGGGVWDIEPSLRRMEGGHYVRYLEVYRRAAVMGNALAGLALQDVYRAPARGILAAIRTNVERPGMVSEKLLSGGEQQSCANALLALENALAAQPSDLNLYALATRPAADFPDLIPLFRVLDAASVRICVPFVQPGYDPAGAKPALDALLALVENYTYIDLYERVPKFSMHASFNRVMVQAKSAGLLVELRGIQKPPARCYVSDPADDRWDVRSCVPPENAFLFKDVHLKIGTMAYLMTGLNYGDFFDLPMKDAKVMPHFRSRVEAEPGYWFTPLERERVAAAMTAILDFLGSSSDGGGLRFRDVYGDPGAPAEVLIQFQRMLDVKPEMCLPFMHHNWDHAEAAAAIDVFLIKNKDRTLKDLYTGPAEPIKPTYTQSEFEQRLKQREATKVLLYKENDLVCDAPGVCVQMHNEYCSTTPWGNCRPE